MSAPPKTAPATDEAALRARIAVVERLVGQAIAALDDGKYGDAGAWLDEADTHLRDAVLQCIALDVKDHP
jgi:allantoicase